MNKIMCGKCRSNSIPEDVGVYYCGFCGQGHEIKKEGEYFVVNPYPRVDEKSNDER